MACSCSVNMINIEDSCWLLPIRVETERVSKDGFKEIKSLLRAPRQWCTRRSGNSIICIVINEISQLYIVPEIYSNNKRPSALYGRCARPTPRLPARETERA